MSIYHITFLVNKYSVAHEDRVTKCTAVLADYSISHSHLKGTLSTHLDCQEPEDLSHKLFLMLMLWYGFINPLSYLGLLDRRFCKGFCQQQKILESTHILR